MLDPDLQKTAREFARGKLSPGELEAWLAGVDYDDPAFSEESKEAAAAVQLLRIEVGEGLRPLKELRAEAKAVSVRRFTQPARSAS